MERPNQNTDQWRGARMVPCGEEEVFGRNTRVKGGVRASRLPRGTREVREGGPEWPVLHRAGLAHTSPCPAADGAGRQAQGGSEKVAAGEVTAGVALEAVVAESSSLAQ